MPKKKFNSKQLWTSASGIECADPEQDGCYRKWYGERVLQLPQPPRKATTFGDVVHEVAERWCSADNNGRDAEGNPVDLYPKGWEYPKDKFTKKPSKACVSPEEQAIIKLLIAKAIEEGVLLKIPGRKLEHKISKWEVFKDIVINGFIDVLEPGAIVDHKTTKDMKWAKNAKPASESKNSLLNNIQLMLYAYWKYTEDGHPVDQPLLLRHNYFCHNIGKQKKKKVKGVYTFVAVPPHVENREVYTSWEEVYLFWTSRIEPVLKQMKRYKDNPKLKFMDLPMPANPEAACRKFGNCQFTKICTGFESVNDYIRRMGGEVDKQNKEYSEMAIKQGGNTMKESPVMKKIREKREAAAAANGGAAAPVETPAAAATPPVEDTTAPAAATSPEGASKAAPWYQEGCTSCAGSEVPGIRPDKSGPCMMCKMRSKKAGGPVPEDFEWDISEGSVIFLDKATGEEVVRQVVAEAATAKTPEATAAPETPAPPAPPAASQEPEHPAADEPGSVPVTASPELFANASVVTEREKFELIIEAAVVESKVKGGGKLGTPSCIITGEELHQMVITHLSAVIGSEGGTAGWWGINAWTRKDAISMYAHQIADMLGSSTIVIGRLTRASELECIVSAIRPYAKRVIHALQG